MVMQGDLTWGGEHTIHCADDVLWNCAPANCIILLTNVTPINSKKGKILGKKVKKCNYVKVY